MRRRDFMYGAIAIASAPQVVVAQKRPRPLIGYLGAGTAPSWKLWTDAFVKRMTELGWVDGRTVDIEYRWGDGLPQRFTEHANELVRRQVDVIVTGGGAVPSVQRATRQIPIIFAVANDPLSAGYVASLSRPGGNVTGMAMQSVDLVGKRLELLRELLPQASTVAVLANVGNQGAAIDLQEAMSLAPRLHFSPRAVEIRTADDIWRSLKGLGRKVDVLYLSRDALLNAHQVRIAELALEERLPGIFPGRDGVIAGGLVSYGPYLPDLFRRAAEMVDKVLRGTPPADIPVEQPTRFELSINLKTARTLGIEVPPMLLARADEVIE